MAMYPNPFYGAAWIGLLVTALNLIPSGQLDGGHAVYAVFGEKLHKLVGRAAFVVMALLSVLGLYFYGSPSGFLFAVILAIMMRIRHPEPLDNSPLDGKRISTRVPYFFDIYAVFCTLSDQDRVGTNGRSLRNVNSRGGVFGTRVRFGK